MCVSGEGGRQPSSCHIYELINLKDPPAQKLPHQLHPEGRADGNLEQALILGQERKYSFFLFSLKICSGLFLSLDAIKTSCGSEWPRQPLPREKENKHSHWRRGRRLCPGAGPRLQPPPTWNWVPKGHGTVPVRLSSCGLRTPGVISPFLL